MRKRTVLITGSTSGIGLAIAKAFAAAGDNIIFNGLEPNGEDIASKVAAASGIDYLFFPANMQQPAALREMVTAAVTRFGVIDVLINNAGVQHVFPIESFPDEKWDEVLAVNLTAAFHLIKASWPGMKAQQSGRIINIASIHGLYASAFKSAYVAAKHGMVGLTKAIALEGAPFGITCNAICPGYVRTPLVDNQVAAQAAIHSLPPEEVISKIILAKHAIKDFVPAETIAVTCLFLASEAAATITGIAMPVDAGWSAQ